jgi:SAM-dependent methyltransferase
VFSQRSIYDRRYAGAGYDERSAVRVLTAERAALRRAAARALAADPSVAQVSLLDFGYGTGRVTNEFALEFAERDLLVVAYDVSLVGLRKAAARLLDGAGFVAVEPLRWHEGKESGYIAGSIRRDALTFVFVHGCESDSPASVHELIADANGRAKFLLTTSWYSGLSHVPGQPTRQELFRVLADLTHDRGELLVAASVAGDLVEHQRYWAGRLRDGNVNGYPIECAGDVLYRTELGQLNFCHVFGTDLADLLDSVCGAGQRGWLEAIRLPGPEFASPEEEAANYRDVRRFNERKARHPWTAEDYAQVHTAAAIRSGSAGFTP